MVRGQAYSPDQLLRMVEQVCLLAADASMLVSPRILRWLERAKEKVTQAAQTDGVLKLAPQLMTELTVQLRQHHATEMNARLTLLRPALQHVSQEFEGAQVATAISNGQLELVKTIPWLDAGWKSLGSDVELSQSTMVQAHREAMRMLLERISLQNNAASTVSNFPELLMLDLTRITDFGKSVRRLAIGVALCTLAVNFLRTAAGIRITEEAATQLQLDVLKAIDVSRTSTELGEETARLMAVYSGEHYSKLPSKEQIVRVMRTALSRREPRNLRALLTKRITAAVVTSGPIVTCLRGVAEELQEVRHKVHKLCSHLESAYMSLYMALLGSRDASVNPSK